MKSCALNFFLSPFLSYQTLHLEHLFPTYQSYHHMNHTLKSTMSFCTSIFCPCVLSEVLPLTTSSSGEPPKWLKMLYHVFSYLILAPAKMAAEKDIKKAAGVCLDHVSLDPEMYRLGHTKASTNFFTFFNACRRSNPRRLSIRLNFHCVASDTWHFFSNPKIQI